MHLLNIQDGAVSDGSEAVDLGQTPADLVVLSAADTDLVGLDAAKVAAGDALPSLRLANYLNLKHNLSVDLYINTVISKAKLVIVRLLGGKAYWPYGVSEIAQTARQLGIAVAFVPGDGPEDPELEALSTVDTATLARLRAYLDHGGPANFAAFLASAAQIAGFDRIKPAPPAPVPGTGYYWQGGQEKSLADCLAKTTLPADAPSALIIFYRAFHLASATQAIDALVEASVAAGLRAVPIYVQSLKDDVSAALLESTIAELAPDIVINLTGFAVSRPGERRTPSILEAADAPILQAVAASDPQSAWAESLRGLSARDTAMNVALPEVDGRLLTRAFAFRQPGDTNALTQHAPLQHVPDTERCRFIADQAAAWCKLRQTPASERHIALILANYPNRDGRLANGVGLDTPASVLTVMRALETAGYGVEDIPETSDALMQGLSAGPTNDRSQDRDGGVCLPRETYEAFFQALPEAVQSAVTERWGPLEDDPFFEGDAGFRLAIHRYGTVTVGIQPARGYNIDPEATYHDPDLPPPHGYIAFYAWLRTCEGIHAAVHLGKHGNLEWLPGKALALSETCFPEAVLGPAPHIYPFIVNDPGEGTQAKRRSSAVIIDHLTPPMTRAESYGALKDLEALVDEFYEAASLDRRRIPVLQREILDAAARAELDREGVFDPAGDEDEAIMSLDNYLCELKEMQIRDGLHVFGAPPQGRLLTDLALAIARTPRGAGEGGDQSLLRALAADFGFDFDPLDAHMATPWTGDKPQRLHDLSGDPWRTVGDTIERLELYSSALLGGAPIPSDMPKTGRVLDALRDSLLPSLEACGDRELSGILTALDGRFVEPGPSGAPTRGRPDVLPTGRNFYSVDIRAVPTQTAWTLGWESAQLLVEDFRQREGMWPKAMTISAWGTANMRTGGDDIAQALALMGVRPNWDFGSRRVTGIEVLPLAMLGRPRVDVTFRVSGFFRDAFPHQMDLLDSAARAIMALDEEAADNPAAHRFAQERADIEAQGVPSHLADLQAGSRVFGSKPGAYGAGLQAMIDEQLWTQRSDLGDTYLEWGSYVYGGGQEGRADRPAFEARIAATDAIVQNQDNREHDLLDSDDYYQFEGGLAAAAEKLTGRMPVMYHNDHSRPETPKVRTLSDEMSRVVRARAANPKWIAGMMRHGYKGAFEMAATLDYLFAFAATTDAVKDHHFDMLHAAYFEDEAVRDFIAEKNPAALREMRARFLEALERGLWQPKRNSLRAELEDKIPLKEQTR